LHRYSRTGIGCCLGLDEASSLSSSVTNPIISHIIQDGILMSGTDFPNKPYIIIGKNDIVIFKFGINHHDWHQPMVFVGVDVVM